MTDDVGRTRYKCLQCGSLYSSRSNLFAHQRLHAGRYPYYCPTCRRGCGSTTYLRSHMQANHGQLLEFKCSCGLICETMKILKEHAQNYQHIQPYEGNFNPWMWHFVISIVEKPEINYLAFMCLVGGFYFFLAQLDHRLTKFAVLFTLVVEI